MLSRFGLKNSKKKLLFSGNMGGNNNPYTPSLYFPFAIKNSLTAQAPDNLSLTFTRASSQTYFDSTGTLQTATTNVAAFDYDPSTLAPLGLSLWEARTNSLRNNTMVGAAAGTPGTNPTNWAVSSAGGSLTTVTIVGTGTESGISYIDYRMIFSGAATGAVQYEQASQIVAALSDVWTNSAYVRLVGGSLTNMQAQLITAEATAAGAFLAATTTNFTPTSAGLATQRTTASRTLNQATVARVYGAVFFTASGAADVTLRIGLPQLELGAFATPVISTTTTAATRAAPVCSTTNLGWYNATEGTFVVSTTAGAVVTANAPIIQIDDGSVNNRALIFQNTIALAQGVNVRSGAALQWAGGAGAFVVGTAVKTALAIKSNDSSTSTAGSAVATQSTLTMPASLTTLRIGMDTVVSYRNGWIASLTYYPLRLPNATLQALST